MPTPGPRDPSRVARQAQMRDQNLGVALRGIVDAAQPPSRAQLAASEGLARATVSGLVDHLIEARLVRELEPTQTQRAGQYPAMTGGALAALNTVLTDPAEWLRTHETP